MEQEGKQKGEVEKGKKGEGIRQNTRERGRIKIEGTVNLN